MTIREQLHNSATHKAGADPACPGCWKVEATTTVLRRGGSICGTTVTLGTRTMKWAGRMTKRSAIEQTKKFWADEDILAACEVKA